VIVLVEPFLLGAFASRRHPAATLRCTTRRRISEREGISITPPIRDCAPKSTSPLVALSLHCDICSQSGDGASTHTQRKGDEHTPAHQPPKWSYNPYMKNPALPKLGSLDYSTPNVTDSTANSTGDKPYFGARRLLVRIESVEPRHRPCMWSSWGGSLQTAGLGRPSTGARLTISPDAVLSTRARWRTDVRIRAEEGITMEAHPRRHRVGPREKRRSRRRHHPLRRARPTARCRIQPRQEAAVIRQRRPRPGMRGAPRVATLPMAAVRVR
jgi:hypothetical protein